MLPSAPRLAPNPRIRPSPYDAAAREDGAIDFGVYNYMTLPVGYGDPEAEYRRLTEGVAMWDVACQRQVALKGPDAARLAQILAPRDLSTCRVGQGKYVPVCDHRGALINDPVILRVDDDEFWLSIADSDMRLWARCLAAERRLDVDVSEADVAPMAIQGPDAEDVVAAMFGDSARDIKFFDFIDAEIEGIPLKLARSGWSKQGGFELYLTDTRRASDLWRLAREAGEPWDIGPGAPNPCERIESGLLSYRGDTDDHTDPFEAGLEKFIDLDVPDDGVAVAALRRIRERGAKRRMLGIVADDETARGDVAVRREVLREGRVIGSMTNGVWSRKLRRHIGFALVESDSRPGDKVIVADPDGEFVGSLRELPFVPPPTRSRASRASRASP